MRVLCSQIYEYLHFVEIYGMCITLNRDFVYYFSNIFWLDLTINHSFITPLNIPINILNLAKPRTGPARPTY